MQRSCPVMDCSKLKTNELQNKWILKPNGKVNTKWDTHTHSLNLVLSRDRNWTHIKHTSHQFHS